MFLITHLGSPVVDLICFPPAPVPPIPVDTVGTVAVGEVGTDDPCGVMAEGDGAGDTLIPASGGSIEGSGRGASM